MLDAHGIEELGVDVPVLDWKKASAKRNQKQSSFNIPCTFFLVLETSSVRYK